jgi:hypothetical protein
VAVEGERQEERAGVESLDTLKADGLTAPIQYR